MYDDQRVQWTMTVTIYHGSSFGHAIELVTETRGRPRDSTHDSLGSWRGVGCPEEVAKAADIFISAAFWDHIVQRYGITERLQGWPIEPDPF